MSKAELLLNDDFRDYRKKEIEEGVSIVTELIKTQCTPEYAKGALDMLKRIILVPLKSTMTDKQRQKLKLAIQKDFDDLHFKTVKRFVSERE